MPQLFLGAKVFTADRRRWAEALLVADDGRIGYVGDVGTARRLGGAGAVEVDLSGALVLPGFVDAHAHVLATGEVERQADLTGAGGLGEIQRRVGEWAAANPGSDWVRAYGWQHSEVPGGRPTRQMLDAVAPDRPAYAQAFDFHSIWLNSAALAVLGIDAATPDPPGGSIARDPATGEPTGYVDETAMHQLVWPFIEEATTDADRDAFLADALRGYGRAGVTAAVDMGLDEDDLAAMVRAERAGTLTARLVGHWVIRKHDDPVAAVARAARLAEEHASPWLRVTGVKLLVDGTVDGCTAALGRPYADGSRPGP
ncbi:amidohydrolase family protein, partial [Spirillospora sp. NPDC049652]